MYAMMVSLDKIDIDYITIFHSILEKGYTTYRCMVLRTDVIHDRSERMKFSSADGKYMYEQFRLMNNFECIESMALVD